MTITRLTKTLIGFAFFLILVLLVSNVTLANSDIDAQTNTLRTQNNLTTLQTSGILTSLADVRAHEIASDFSHRSLNAEISANFDCWQLWGENIEYVKPAVNATSEFLVQGWYASPEHRSNMLGDYGLQGSAIYVEESTNTAWAVQIFLRTCNSPSPNPDPTRASRSSAIPSAVTPPASSTPQETQPVVQNTSRPTGTQTIELPNTNIK